MLCRAIEDVSDANARAVAGESSAGDRERERPTVVPG